MKTIIIYSILSLISLTSCTDKFLQRKYTHFSKVQSSENVQSMQALTAFEKMEMSNTSLIKEDIRGAIIRKTVSGNSVTIKKDESKAQRQSSGSDKLKGATGKKKNKEIKGRLIWNEKERVMESFVEINESSTSASFQRKGSDSSSGGSIGLILLAVGFFAVLFIGFLVYTISEPIALLLGVVVLYYLIIVIAILALIAMILKALF